VKADAIMVQNARTFIVGRAPVIGGLDGEGFSKRWFAGAKETWQDVRNVDALLDGVEPVLSTAVLYSEPTREELSGQKTPQDFRSSVLGALETMAYAGRPVESIQYSGWRRRWAVSTCWFFRRLRFDRPPTSIPFENGWREAAP
jgi:hypothetical protein